MLSNAAANAAEKAGTMAEELTHEISVFPSFDFYIAGYHLHITESITMMWFVMAILIIAAFVFTRKLETFPGKVQNFVEAAVDAINSLAKNVLGHHWKPYAPYFGTLLLFLAISNTIAMFGIKSLRPPTKDISVTAAMAIMTIILVIGSQIFVKGIGGTIKSWFEPMWVIFPFKILDYFTRPLSLCLRLFGNIFGAFVMMELVILATHNIVLPPIFSLYFDIFDGMLQAFIFVFLSMLYVGEAIE